MKRTRFLWSPTIVVGLFFGGCLSGCSMTTTGFHAESIPKGIWTVDVGPSSASFDGAKLVEVTANYVADSVKWLVAQFNPAPVP